MTNNKCSSIELNTDQNNSDLPTSNTTEGDILVRFSINFLIEKRTNMSPSIQITRSSNNKILDSNTTSNETGIKCSSFRPN
ncbi:hypothetical protein Bhyg_12494 [Pseudolycoriella hygida]|uniref:Uncharacterized protein n=1 Tax=Pseudolycoriella hygida TaxID=35572 RepID=A0A9Q0MZN8_9DIPT|nr:hypothetical protein Bhyg_12494 [Pseudolycoriella hygida]